MHVKENSKNMVLVNIFKSQKSSLIQFFLFAITGTSADSDRACDWFCRLLDQAEGQCTEARVCDCSGTLDSGVDLFKVEARKGEEDLSGLPSFLQNIIFLPLSRSYFFRERKNLLTPRFYELTNTENFYLPTSDGGSLGAWHIAPEASPGGIESLTQDDKLVVYMHGNSLGELILL